MNKVYCKNCKYWRSLRYYVCNKIISVSEMKVDDAYERNTYYFNDKVEWKKENKLNDCKYYETYWWKFWIK